MTIYVPFDPATVSDPVTAPSAPVPPKSVRFVVSSTKLVPSYSSSRIDHAEILQSCGSIQERVLIFLGPSESGFIVQAPVFAVVNFTRIRIPVVKVVSAGVNEHT